MTNCVTIKTGLWAELQCFNVGSVPMFQKKNEQLILMINLWAESRELLLCTEHEVAWFSSWGQSLEVSFINTEGALRRPMITTHPNFYRSEWSHQAICGFQNTSNELKWTKTEKQRDTKMTWSIDLESRWSVDWKFISDYLHSMIKSLPWAHWWSPGWPLGCATKSSRRSHLCSLIAQTDHLLNWIIDLWLSFYIHISNSVLREI